MDSYASHQPLLLHCLFLTKGQVLELGAGNYSTLILHEVCAALDRQLVTIDCDEKWLNTFMDLASPKHELMCVGMTEEFRLRGTAQIRDHQVWQECKRIDQNTWGLVLVDHRPGERRKDDILRLKDDAQIIVVHDSQEPGYRYEPIFSKFAYRVDYKRFDTWTTALSQTIPL